MVKRKYVVIEEDSSAIRWSNSMTKASAMKLAKSNRISNRGTKVKTKIRMVRKKR